jgi:hypothetical protein
MKGFFAVIFGVLLSFSAEAAMIQFYVIETGVPANVERKRCSELWENALMDVFFDSGHIVTNAPILRLAAKPDGGIAEAAKVRVDEAVDGGSDYIFIAMLDYPPESGTPSEVSFYSFRIANPNIIYERQFTRRTNGASVEEYQDLKTLVREVVPFFNN